MVALVFTTVAAETLEATGAVFCENAMLKDNNNKSVKYFKI